MRLAELVNGKSVNDMAIIEPISRRRDYYGMVRAMLLSCCVGDELIRKCQPKEEQSNRSETFSAQHSYQLGS